MRKRLEVMSRQCEMMEKEKNGLQRALGVREREISSLLRYIPIAMVSSTALLTLPPLSLSPLLFLPPSISPYLPPPLPLSRPSSISASLFSPALRILCKHL